MPKLDLYEKQLTIRQTTVLSHKTLHALHRIKVWYETTVGDFSLSIRSFAQFNR